MLYCTFSDSNGLLIQMALEHIERLVVFVCFFSSLLHFPHKRNKISGMVHSFGEIRYLWLTKDSLTRFSYILGEDH